MDITIKDTKRKNKRITIKKVGYVDATELLFFRRYNKEYTLPKNYVLENVFDQHNY